MVTTTRNTATVRIGRRAHERLRAIAARTGEQIGDVLDRAIEREERRLFWQQFHESVERLRSDPAAWAAYQAESKELDATLTLADDLEPDEDWSFLLDAKLKEFEFRDPHAANAVQDTGRAPAR